MTIRRKLLQKIRELRTRVIVGENRSYNVYPILLVCERKRSIHDPKPGCL